jgi:hypothetical protein
MPKSIKKPSSDVRCPSCEKLLATPEGIKCPRCKRVHSYEECFSKELRPDQYSVAFLWAPDGGHASSIVIRKEIWLNVGNKVQLPEGQWQYPVFFLYNYLDPSKAFANDVGCRVNKEPFLDFNEALELARKHEREVRASRAWVGIDEIVEPELQKPKNGVWDFRSLERMAKKGIAIDFADLAATLEWYADGSSINPTVVIKIIETVGLDPTRSALHAIAEKGMKNAGNLTTEKEWHTLLLYLLAQR